MLLSVVIRDPPRLLPLAAGVATAEVVGPDARLKWPNDVLLGGRKVAGILVEGRPQEGWAVLGIGLNVAVRTEDFPAELRGSAGGMGLEPEALEPTLERLLDALGRWIEADPATSSTACGRAMPCSGCPCGGLAGAVRPPASIRTGG